MTSITVRESAVCTVVAPSSRREGVEPVDMTVGVVARERKRDEAARALRRHVEPVWGNDTSSGASPRFTVSQSLGHGLVSFEHRAARPPAAADHGAAAHQIGSGGDVRREIAVVVEPRRPARAARARTRSSGALERSGA